jgi:hypothetical protein
MTATSKQEIRDIKKEIKRLQNSMVAASPKYREMYLQLIREELAKLEK